MKTISVIGCGWLGLPLAKQLLKKGYRVKGSTTSEERLVNLDQAGIEASKLEITDSQILYSDEKLFSSDVAFVNIPPRRRPDIEAYHPKQIEQLLAKLKYGGTKQIVFASSTSVYPNTGGMVDETCNLTAEKGSGKALQIVEQSIMKAYPNSVILRFGGLIGSDRNPGRFLSGKTDLKNPEVPINLIHLDDCIGIVETVLEKEIEGEIFNAVCTEHPTRREFYTKAAEKTGLPIPQFKNENNSEFKVVDNSYLKRKLNYLFKFDNPNEMIE